MWKTNICKKQVEEQDGQGTSSKYDVTSVLPDEDDNYDVELDSQGRRRRFAEISNGAVIIGNYEDDNQYKTTCTEPSGGLVEIINYDEDEQNKARRCIAVDDEYDAIGVNVAAKLRGLTSSMRVLAEKLINDVLFQAQTNGLTSATVLITPDPFK